MEKNKLESLRHAHATRIAVEWRRQGEAFVCAVEDDGCGFDSAATRAGSRGLANIRSRASEIGARLLLESQVGTGTRLQLSIPHDAVQTATHAR